MLNQLIPKYNEIYNEYFQKAQSVTNYDQFLCDENNHITNLSDLKKLVDLGFNRLHVSKLNGGFGLNAKETAVAFLALGNGCINNGLNFSIGAQAFSVNTALEFFGTEDQKSKYLNKSLAGEFFISTAMTEKESGSDAFQMKTEATLNNNRFIINGRKDYITQSVYAHYFLLYALTDSKKGSIGGISAFLIDAKTLGVKIGVAQRKMGLKTASFGSIVFDNVEVSTDKLLGQEGAGTGIFNHAMIWERTMLSALNLGLFERVFKAVLNFVENANRGGGPIISYSNVSGLISDAKIFIQASKLLIFDAAHAIDADPKHAFLKSSIAKAHLAENGLKYLQQLQLTCGAHGYLEENMIERDLRDFTAFNIYSGSQFIQRKIISNFI